MKKDSFLQQLQRFEFENRVWISLGDVIMVALLSFLCFPHIPSNMVLIGNMLGMPASLSVPVGFSLVAFIVLCATILRMWGGTVLSSPLVMSFKLQKEELIIKGPFIVSRNPIYLADFFAFCAFALCFTPIGVLLPILQFLHYHSLIIYEEKGFEEIFGTTFLDYKKSTPRFFPNLKSIKRIPEAFADFHINKDGMRHNAQYVFLIPGFIVAAFTGNLFHAILIGLLPILDWVVVHTKIGLNPDKARKENLKKATDTATLKEAKVFGDIIYSQCWEDPVIDIKAFESAPEGNVFSITSGGCNSLAFLTQHPSHLAALDLSPYQNHLLDLKMAAFRELTYEELLEFVGVLPSDNRMNIYTRLKKHLKPESVQYWDDEPDKINLGIIYCGRYENYMQFLTKWLKLLVGKDIPEQLFACKTKAERQYLYEHKWNNLRWRFFTKVFLSRTMMTMLFTGRFFDQLEESFSFGDHFRTNIKHAIIDLPLQENYFLAFILLGRFYDLDQLPFYLRKENFETIKSQLERIEIITGDTLSYFRSLPSDSISRFNFSNIFEWIGPAAHEEILKETIRVAKNGAILTYRNLLVPRSRPETLAQWIVPQTALAEKLLSEDRSFVYRAYIVEKINK